MIIFCAWTVSSSFLSGFCFLYFQIKKSISQKIINFFYTHRHINSYVFLLLLFHNWNDSQKKISRVESQTKKALYCVILFWGIFYSRIHIFSLLLLLILLKSRHIHSFEAILLYISLSFYKINQYNWWN